MTKNVIKIILLTMGAFIFSVAEAYTMQDYNEADEAVVTAQSTWYQAIADASWSNFQSQLSQAQAENRAGIIRCQQVYPENGAPLQECIDQVNDEYTRTSNDLNQQWMDAQAAMANAQNAVIAAQAHFDEVRNDLVAQGLLPP